MFNLKNEVKATDTAYSHDQASKYDDKRFTTIAGMQVHNMELKMLNDSLLAPSKAIKVLEVGCGTGRLLTELNKSGYVVDGVDASPDMLMKLEEKVSKDTFGPKFYVSESVKMPFEDNCYDFVYSIRLLNQTESEEYALNTIREMIRVTRPGGFILAEFVNSNRPQIGRNATKTVRLSHELISNSLLESNECVSVVKNMGVFLFGMGTIQRTPKLLLGFISTIDKMCASVLPKLCSRGYVLLMKDSSDAK